MKKVLTLALASTMLLTMAACGGSSGSSSAASSSSLTASSEPTEAPNVTTLPQFSTVEQGKLHMSTNAAFPPYEMLADDGSFEGIDVEVAGKIAEMLHLELVVDDMDFDAALLAAQNGQSDIVMAGVTVTEERQQVMNFSDSYATGIQSIIVKEGSPIQSVDDLATAAMIGTQRGTTGYIYCSDDFGEDHVTAYTTGATAVQALVNDQVDCVVIDNMPAKEYVQSNPGLKILDTEYVEEHYAIGMSKDNPELLEAINIVMKMLQEDGTIQGIVDTYITTG